MVEMQSALAGLRVRDAIMTRFRTLETKDTLAKAVTELLAGSQQDFPVIENDQPVGILRRNDLVKSLSEGRRDTAVTEGMSRDCETVDEATPLKSAVESMRERQCATMPVMAGGPCVWCRPSSTSIASCRNVPPRCSRVAPANSQGRFAMAPCPPSHHPARQFDQTVGSSDQQPGAPRERKRDIGDY